MSENPFVSKEAPAEEHVEDAVIVGETVEQAAQQPAQQPAQQQVATQQQAAAPAIANPPTIPSGDVTTVSFDDDVKLNQLDKFPKMKKDETCRFAFVLFDEKGAPQLKMSSYFYDKASNNLFLAPKNKDVLQQVVNKVGEAKIRFGTIVLKYHTDQYGNLTDSGYDLYAYIFSTDKFPIFKSLHKEWGLANHDILLTCTEAEFQKVQPNVAKDCLYKANPQLAAQIMQEAKELFDQKLNRFMGRHMEDHEILQALGLMAPGMAAPMGGQPAGGVNPGFNPFAAQQAGAQPADGAGMAQQVGTGGQQEDFSDLVANQTQQS